MKTHILLRSVREEGKNALSLFDSNRNAGIDNLVTEVEAGSTVVWQLDCLSGLKSINKIYFKRGKDNSFGAQPTRKLFSKEWVLRIPKDAKGEEAYGIEYTLCDGKKIDIDPLIKISPPKP